MENRQTIINDYITSQHMHHNPSTAMAQRADMLRGLPTRDPAMALNYTAGPRSMHTMPFSFVSISVLLEAPYC